ncbi:MAG: hypothetical protein V4523_09955 [Pseudomonadota bacterium]
MITAIPVIDALTEALSAAHLPIWLSWRSSAHLHRMTSPDRQVRLAWPQLWFMAAAEGTACRAFDDRAGVPQGA